MKIFHAVERGIEIPENLDDLVIPEEKQNTVTPVSYTHLAAAKVAFDENGGALNILNEWKKLYDAGYAPNVGLSLIHI